MRNSPNRLLLAVLAAFKVGVSYALFALFGGLCAFVFFGFFGKPPYGLKLEAVSYTHLTLPTNSLV